VAARTLTGRLGCFEHPVAPPRELLRWFIDHPDQLRWPPGTEYSKETTTLRRALLYDDPPGSQAKAQARARELLAEPSTPSPKWWRFEGISKLDCVLITNRLVVTVEGKRTEGLSPATNWYPTRSQLVRNLEAAKQIAGEKAWASVLISEQRVAGGGAGQLKQSLPESAPHLNEPKRRDLAAAYLGNLTWRAACEAVGISFDLLPETTTESGPRA
jgi:hypothetical protein